MRWVAFYKVCSKAERPIDGTSQDYKEQEVQMRNSTPEPMDSSSVCCPNAMCSARGQKGLGNIVIHDPKRQRYRCKACRRTFSARRGTMFEGLRKPMDLIVIVVTHFPYGCPIQAIVHAFDLD